MNLNKKRDNVKQLIPHQVSAKDQLPKRLKPNKFNVIHKTNRKTNRKTMSKYKPLYTSIL
jgi:hypothetical protein